MKVPFPVRAVPFLTFRAWLTPPPVGAKTTARDRVVFGGLAVFAAGGFGSPEGAHVAAGQGRFALGLHRGRHQV
jgi:hypothetical protein